MTLEEQVEALNKKNKELLDEMKPFKDLKKSLDDLGGLDTIKAILNSNEELKKKVETASTDVNVVRTQLTSQIEAEKKAKENLKNRVAKTKLNEKLRTVVTEQGGVWDILEPHLNSRVKFEYDENTDELKLEVLDKEGKALMSNGKAAELSDLVGEFKTNESFKKTFEINTARSGTGTPPATGGKTSPNNPFVGGTLDAQTKLFQENPTLARRLQAEAKGVTA